MLMSGVRLNEMYINRLIMLGVNYIYVCNDYSLIDTNELKELNNVKIEMIKSFSNVFSKVQEYERPSFKEVGQNVEKMIHFIKENKTLNSSFLLDLKTYDNYTYIHSLNVAILSIFFGVKMNKNKDELMNIGVGGILHDIGKAKIPIEILNKKGKLTYEEFEIMKKHPAYGYETVCISSEISDESKKAILYHHEKLDGSGYPYGADRDEINLCSRIVTISDVYDAVASDRIYRKAFSAMDAYEYILGGSGTLFDPDVVKIFRDEFCIYPLGTSVKLSNGKEGVISDYNVGFPDKPVVVIANEKGVREVNLVKALDIRIEEVL